ncbi:MAG TPA: DUF58 domain-containing protein [Acidimicrobiales bacterium]|nr:DUF58 domain-containing protein [Acidimicrobiales bacterium]
MIPVPTARLVVAAAVASVLVLASPWPGAILWAVDLALLAVAAVDWGRAPRPSTIPVERDLPGVVPLGGEAEVVWTVRNPGSRTLRLTLADELAPSLDADSRRARVVVPPGGRAMARTAIRPRRRGKFTPTEIVVRIEGPWRLAARQGRLQVPGVLRVYPPFRSREEAELRIDRARILEIGLRSAPGRGGGTEFDQLREYTVDDEFRRIDWSATARIGRPIVRTYRAERNQTVLLLLDGGRMMAGRVAGVPRLDHAMDAVMMLTAVASRLGDKIGLVAFDQVVRAVVPPRSGREQLGRVTEAMYALEPQLVESDYRGAFASTLGRFRRRSLLVLFTELAEQAVTETVLPVLPLLSRHHLVIVASVSDPDLGGWATEVPADASATYRKAAAVTARTDRARTVALLRGLGATVVDAEPGRLAPLLADAYLKVKATGRL